MGDLLIYTVFFVVGFVISPLHGFIKVKDKEQRIKRMEILAQEIVKQSLFGVRIDYKNDNVKYINAGRAGRYYRCKDIEDRRTGVFRSLSRGDIRHLARFIIETGKAEVCDIDTDEEYAEEYASDLLRRVDGIYRSGDNG